MLIKPIDIFVHAWLIVAVLSAAYVAWDQFTGNPDRNQLQHGFIDQVIQSNLGYPGSPNPGIP